ncbi:2885_t:CDS:2, partial [Cetraspora pellucida]
EVENVNTKDDNSSKEIKDEKEEFQLNWMHLTEINSNIIINYFSELGSYNIDLNFDWINDAKQYYSSTNIIDVDTFLRCTSSSFRVERNSNIAINTVNYEMLNKNQKKQEQKNHILLEQFKSSFIKWSELNLNHPYLEGWIFKLSIAKIFAMHIGDYNSKIADSDVVKSLEAQLLLAKGVYNGLLSFLVAVFIAFDNYKKPTITTLDSVKVMPIIPIQCI